MGTQNYLEPNKPNINNLDSAGILNDIINPPEIMTRR